VLVDDVDNYVDKSEKLGAELFRVVIDITGHPWRGAPPLEASVTPADGNAQPLAKATP
jgi:hypothetical protein